MSKKESVKKGDHVKVLVEEFKGRVGTIIGYDDEDLFDEVLMIVEFPDGMTVAYYPHELEKIE